MSSTAIAHSPIAGEIMVDDPRHRDVPDRGDLAALLHAMARDLVHLAGELPDRSLVADEPLFLGTQALEAAVHRAFVANIDARVEPKR